jgi:hypothetical protein
VSYKWIIGLDCQIRVEMQPVEREVVFGGGGDDGDGHGFGCKYNS